MLAPRGTSIIDTSTAMPSASSVRRIILMQLHAGCGGLCDAPRGLTNPLVLPDPSSYGRSLCWLHHAICKAQQQTGDAARNETDPYKVLNKLKAGRRPMCACHNPEHKGDHSIDQDPDGPRIFAEHEKEKDLDYPFGNENDADYQREKNYSK
jgi:hypothetical protein